MTDTLLRPVDYHETQSDPNDTLSSNPNRERVVVLAGVEGRWESEVEEELQREPKPKSRRDFDNLPADLDNHEEDKKEKPKINQGNKESQRMSYPVQKSGCDCDIVLV